jgi:hypothetical protein
MTLRPDSSKPARPSHPTRPVRPGTPPRPTSDNPSAQIKSPILSAASLPKRSARAQVLRQLDRRRTFIPILLTTGVLFCLFGAAQWLTDADYPFSATNMTWSAIALPGLGVLLLAMAVMNMLHVRGKLKEVG